MSHNHDPSSMPPGLKSQIIFAIVITVAALFLLPTALSARSTGQSTHSHALRPSAGAVSTSVRVFAANDFPASAFSDWEH